MASSSHRRPRPERRTRRVPVVTVVAVAAVALVVSLVVAFRPDGGSETGADGGARTVEPAAGSGVSGSPTATGST
ncbi:hypothetical protein AB0L81_23695, partial [Streptomyces sp. NPDC052127]